MAFFWCVALFLLQDSSAQCTNCDSFSVLQTKSTIQSANTDEDVFAFSGVPEIPVGYQVFHGPSMTFCTGMSIFNRRSEFGECVDTCNADSRCEFMTWSLSERGWCRLSPACKTKNKKGDMRIIFQKIIPTPMPTPIPTLLPTPSPTPVPTPVPTPDTANPLPNSTLCTGKGINRKESAMFLMQASFGQTRNSIEELWSMGCKRAWIEQQLAMPILSHREFYRANVNKPFDATTQPGFSPTSKCSKGSRWHASTFIRADVGNSVTIIRESGVTQIRVGKDLRTEIDPDTQVNDCGDQAPSNWVRKGWKCENEVPKKQWNCESSEFKENQLCKKSCFNIGKQLDAEECSVGWNRVRFKEGYVCEVYPWRVVKVAANRDCNKGVQFLPNPKIWLQDPSKPLQTERQFASEDNNRSPDVVFLDEDATRESTCEFDTEEFIMVNGNIYIYEMRMMLDENLPSNPSVGKACVGRNEINSNTCIVLPRWSACDLSCGSAGEAVNNPLFGHRMSFGQFLEDPDEIYDGNFKNDRRMRGVAKHTVWTTFALKGESQLHQRMAWALSQILVTSAKVLEMQIWNELFVNYYDIMVKHAFGNYHDLLREVTWSPLMGNFLSYVGSRSYDRSGSAADENYAREIMQLFSIGLCKLDKLGSCEVDASGSEIATYDNSQIMSIARVFTGFRYRKQRRNVEAWTYLPNLYDSMYMNGLFHDNYPKQGLDGKFIGDGYPLCADIPARSWLTKGAKYEFAGYSYRRDADTVLVLSDESLLKKAICGSGNSQCEFLPSIELDEDIQCTGAECDGGDVRVVKVNGALYNYVTPPCVHLFFANKRVVSFGKNSDICADPGLPLAFPSCCRGCKDTIWPKLADEYASCAEAAKADVDKDGQPRMFTRFCNQNPGWQKKRYCELTCWRNNADWDGKLAYEGSDGTMQEHNNCSHGEWQEIKTCRTESEKRTFDQAEAFCKARGMDICPEQSDEGCSGRFKAYMWTKRVCSDTVVVQTDGSVQSSSARDPEKTSFNVQWISAAGFPAPGTYSAVEDRRAVFSDVPSAEDVVRLTIGAFPPGLGCSHNCGGNVEAFSATGTIDVDTVFAYDGRWFKNVESIVQLSDGYAFRNPPAFMRPFPFPYTENDAADRAAIAEVDALLDHLMTHKNTPLFISKKLIQRFVTSNPSPTYLGRVAEAFRTGTYGGTTYGGRLGDLKATIVAILSEAEASEYADASSGLLREPWLKVVQFMRSLEYQDRNGDLVTPVRVDEMIGEFPYEADSVFSYFDALYSPPDWTDEQSKSTLTAPEFQIHTTPLWIMLTNALFELTKHGLSDCAGGFGNGFRYSLGKSCVQGTLALPERAHVDHQVAELDLLLTAGRLTESNSEKVKRIIEDAAVGERVQQGARAIALTPEFHTLGDPLPLSSRTDISSKVKSTTTTDEDAGYKAMVLLFLQGGADTYNVLMPMNCDLFQQYSQRRGGAALEARSLLPIQARTRQHCGKFGLHPSLRFVKTLYEKQKKLAFVSNIGSLVEPTTRASWIDHSAQTCNEMFSHTHQQNGVQTLKCQVMGPKPRGAGGRLADDIAAQGLKTASFAMSGSQTWGVGFETTPEFIDSLVGLPRLAGADGMEDFIGNLSSQGYGNVYCDEYVKTIVHAMDSSEKLGAVLDSAELKTEYVAEESLSRQFKQVARIISTAETRRANRDFFFVGLHGWDHHTDVMKGLEKKLSTVDSALEGFVAEMQAQRKFDSVVVATASDFGRTLTFNGEGTDHGWGGNQFVLGGKINGGRVLNDFLTTYAAESEFDAGHGRVIPKYPIENMMVPIAEWMGANSIETLFPNLGNFNRSTHILSKETLFETR